MESKGSTAKVASGLLFALAICCSVMYMTADGGEEADVALQETYIGAGMDLAWPRRKSAPYGPSEERSVEAVDVKKAATIVIKVYQDSSECYERQDTPIETENTWNSNLANY